MANVEAAIEHTLKQEDATLSGEVTNIKGDRGGRTRFGIAEASHPHIAETGLYDCDRDKALVIAKGVYAKDYGEPLKLTEIADQHIANAMLSFAVNEGTQTSIKVAQDAINAHGAQVEVDGFCGPSTVGIINKCDPVEFLKNLKAAQIRHYDAIIAAHPTDVKFEAGWMNRIDSNCSLQ